MRRLIDRIDRGYDDGVATSNMLMGIVMGSLLLVALSVEAGWLRNVLAGSVALVFIFFGWRMILSFRRQFAARDRRRSRNG